MKFGERRLFFAGDLHLGMNLIGDAATKRLVAYLAREVRPGDVICLTGDLGVRDADVLTCFELFESLPCHKAFVLGNQDVWLFPEDGHVTSDARMRFLHRKGQNRGFFPVHDEPLILSDLAFVGSTAWYDETFRDPDLQAPTQAYIDQVWEIGSERSAWPDAAYVHWSWKMEETAERFLVQLKRQLESVRHLPQVVVLLHHLPTKKLLPHPWLRRVHPALISKRWRFANAFLGSGRFCQLICQYPNVSRVVCGHAHWPGEARLSWRTRAYALGGSYTTKELLILTDRTTTRVTF